MVDDIEDAVAELVARGVSFEHTSDSGVDASAIVRKKNGDLGPKAIAWFKDPSGHSLSLFEK